VRDGKAGGIIAFDLKRIGRAKTAEMLAMIEDVESVGGQLYDQNGRVSVDDADAELMTTMKAMIGRREWRERREDLLSKRRERDRARRPPLGPVRLSALGREGHAAGDQRGRGARRADGVRDARRGAFVAGDRRRGQRDRDHAAALQARRHRQAGGLDLQDRAPARRRAR
jgi:hypothetical protein